MDPQRYLARLDFDPGTVATDHEALARLQRAHVLTVPFENFSITGDPTGTYTPEGISLELPDLFEKIVDNGRGGFCYELNGLFGWLLGELGFDVRRVTGRVLTEDGEARPPANHLTNVVTLGREYVVDVGVATPAIRRPLPLDGDVIEDSAGVAWRVTGSDRPDADYQVQFRNPDADSWSTRYVFRDQTRELEYVTATCEYLETAPESPFTGDPFATIATERGHCKLKHGTLSSTERGETDERPVPEEELPAVLESEFGLAVLSAGD